MFIGMYRLCDHMISCSNLCSTSLIGGPISLLPCRLSQNSLQLRWPWDPVHASQTHAGVTWGILEKLLCFLREGSDPDGTIPFSFFPPWTWMVRLVLWWPRETPEEWPRESQGWNPELWQMLSGWSSGNNASNCLPLGFLLNRKRQSSLCPS